MAYAGGAFKTNSVHVIPAVKESNQTGGRRAARQQPEPIKIRARNLAKMRLLPKK
jgi:hypothetical protein